LEQSTRISTEIVKPRLKSEVQGVEGRTSRGTQGDWLSISELASDGQFLMRVQPSPRKSPFRFGKPTFVIGSNAHAFAGKTRMLILFAVRRVVLCEVQRLLARVGPTPRRELRCVAILIREVTGLLCHAQSNRRQPRFGCARRCASRSSRFRCLAHFFVTERTTRQLRRPAFALSPQNKCGDHARRASIDGRSRSGRAVRASLHGAVQLRSVL